MSHYELPTDYQKFIHASRYARFRDDLGRRESWGETVDRYFDYFIQDLEERHNYKPSQNLTSALKDAVGGLSIVPSMRALMTAGEAARRENISVYNCAYQAFDRTRSFAEALYILMCGTGLGFTVERQVISKLPEVPAVMNRSVRQIVVQDSKRGWAQGYDELIHALYAGEVPSMDVSNVRKAGERLRTFGGRSSGPEPFLELCDFTIRTFYAARGRKLNSLEVHEIATMTGKIVVVGGVRRAAEISLSNLSDLRMRDAKSGDWFTSKSHLALANNSVAYTEKPEVGTFMDEWSALYKSKSGERGMFNRQAAIVKVTESGKRSPDFDFGTNPCGEIILRPRGLCNLSEVVARENDSKGELQEKMELATILGTWQSTQTSFNFVEPEWAINAKEERLLGVSLTGIFDNQFLSGRVPGEDLAGYLRESRENLNVVNCQHAEDIGIPRSAGITTIKPSGTVSQLVVSPPGIHPGHSPFYERRVSQDNKDPITQFLKDSGVPNEPSVYSPTMTVFSFPVKLGKETVLREELTAIEHMELVKLYNLNWSEHAVSCTISVHEDEWPEVGGWVYSNFDSILGMSFLPYMENDSMYQQKPYDTIQEDEYLLRTSEMPKLDWADLKHYEKGEDHVTGTQEFACVGNSCDLSLI